METVFSILTVVFTVLTSIFLYLYMNDKLPKEDKLPKYFTWLAYVWIPLYILLWAASLTFLILGSTSDDASDNTANVIYEVIIGITLGVLVLIPTVKFFVKEGDKLEKTTNTTTSLPASDSGYTDRQYRFNVL